MTELSDFHLGLFVTVYIAFWIPPLSLLVLIVGVYFENARSYLKRYVQKCQCPLHSSCPSPSPVSPVPMNNQSLSVWSLLFVFSQNKQIHVYFLTSAFFFFFTRSVSCNKYSFAFFFFTLTVYTGNHSCHFVELFFILFNSCMVLLCVDTPWSIYPFSCVWASRLFLRLQ